MDKVDITKMEILNLELAPLPEQANDERYDGVLHITTQQRQPELPDLPDRKRGSFQAFTFN